MDKKKLPKMVMKCSKLYFTINKIIYRKIKDDYIKCIIYNKIDY